MNRPFTAGPLTVRVTDIEVSERLFGNSDRSPCLVISLMAGETPIHSVEVEVHPESAQVVAELLAMVASSLAGTPALGKLSASPRSPGNFHEAPIPVMRVTSELRTQQAPQGAYQALLEQEQEQEPAPPVYSPPQRALPLPPRTPTPPQPAPGPPPAAEQPPEYPPSQPLQTHLPAVTLRPRAPAGIQGALDAVPRRTR
jgi:hypothetical protein